MKDKEKYHNLIDDYLLGNLADNDLFDFEQNLRKDESLERDVMLAKEMKEAVLEREVMYYREVVQDALTRKPTRLNSSFFLKIAASIAVLFTLGLYFYDDFVPKSSVDLAEVYFKPYENLVSARGNQINDSLLLLAMHHYDARAYKNALEYLVKLNPNDSDLIPLYITVCLASDEALLGSYDVPKIDFGSVYYGHWLYYRGIIHLRRNEKKLATIVFSELKKKGSKPYSDWSAEILDQLK